MSVFSFALRNSKTTLGLLACMALPAQAQSVAQIKKPKLVLVLVIDQFRADLIRRFEPRFLPAVSGGKKLGGFRYLLEKGAYFPFAEYGLIQNMTCPGHATILSGAYAYQNGIAINDWTDGKTGKSIYCVQDDKEPLVGPGLKGDRSGISPRNFHGSTFGDELKNSGYASKVVTIALKDRAAVLLGGYRNDLALWYDIGTHSWITSHYYRPDGTLPAWVTDLNETIAKDVAKDKTLTWTLSEGGGERSLADNALMSKRKSLASMGQDFPHHADKDTVNALMFPYSTELTANAAIAALESMKLGTGKDPDVLAVSFSNHDFASHNFGPNSREVEELTVVEDREIGRLFTEVEQKIGMENVIVVLTADHGSPPNPDWLKSQKVDAGRVDEEKLQLMAETYLSATFGKPIRGSWIYATGDFNFYFNYNTLNDKKLELDKVAQSLTQYFRKSIPTLEGIADAYCGADVRNNTLPPSLFQKLIRQTYIPGRSGDVVLIPKPYYIVPGATTTHLSAYAYDRTVPLLIAGPQIKQGVYATKVEVIDIAPTLSFFTGTLPPSGSEGRILSEAIGDVK
ncbi:MAG: alkaline phosphatase family protein [Chitinophagaceae bacterium]|nr:alkaline phosphatase family protein [Oligoflexus sp.]